MLRKKIAATQPFVDSHPVGSIAVIAQYEDEIPASFEYREVLEIEYDVITRVYTVTLGEDTADNKERHSEQEV